MAHKFKNKQQVIDEINHTTQLLDLMLMPFEDNDNSERIEEQQEYLADLEMILEKWDEENKASI
jgi:hypothetical protein